MLKPIYAINVSSPADPLTLWRKHKSSPVWIKTDRYKEEWICQLPNKSTVEQWRALTCGDTLNVEKQGRVPPLFPHYEPAGGASSLREIMWQLRTKSQLNKGKTTTHTLSLSPKGQWARRKGREGKMEKAQKQIFKLSSIDRQSDRPSAIHLPDFACWGKVALNHPE